MYLSWGLARGHVTTTSAGPASDTISIVNKSRDLPAAVDSLHPELSQIIMVWRRAWGHRVNISREVF